MYLDEHMYKLRLVEKSAKRVVLQKNPDCGINDFCNLVRWQLKDPDFKLQEAFELVVYMTKFN